MIKFRDNYTIANKMYNDLSIERNPAIFTTDKQYTVKKGLSFICPECGKKYSINKKVNDICIECNNKI
jgi:uncharacterized protein (DUF983 family)